MKNPLVFTDFHHASLLNSLIMLFEGRLGGQVYRPIGTEWAEQGFWKVYDHPATIEQFLGIGGATPDGTPELNRVDPAMMVLDPTPGLFYCKDIEGDKYNKAITLATFLELPIDIVIASLPAHIEPFKHLCEIHPNHPKLIFQIGNAWTVDAGMAPNIMASAIINDVPKDINFISYHQEFDLNVFKFTPPLVNGTSSIEWPNKSITSFVNVFSNFPDFPLFERVEEIMGDYTFKSLGGQCRDGSANGSQELADAMKGSRFIWHTKAGGDGYGHIIHNAAAIGRPLITKKSYYNGKLAEPLMVDGVTCIDIDGLGEYQIIEKINYYADAERYQKMCQAVYDKFQEVVDFDREALAMNFFLENLK